MSILKVLGEVVTGLTTNGAEGLEADRAPMFAQHKSLD